MFETLYAALKTRNFGYMIGYPSELLLALSRAAHGINVGKLLMAYHIQSYPGANQRNAKRPMNPNV